MPDPFKKNKAKAALARSNQIEILVIGDYENDRQKFLSLSQHLGVVYLDNVVTSSVIDTDVTTLQNEMNAVESEIATIKTVDLVNIVNRLNVLESFVSSTYPIHTHNYEDGTINDTADGTGTQTDTTRTTTGVN